MEWVFLKMKAIDIKFLCNKYKEQTSLFKMKARIYTLFVFYQDLSNRKYN